MNMSDLAYAYEQIEQMAGQLKNFVGQLEARLSGDVDREFKNLVANGWTGKGANAFQNASATWHGKTLEMNTTLTQLQTALSTAGTDMSATDNSLVGLFG
jgi:WXG100 family type VII secretion target